MAIHDPTYGGYRIFIGDLGPKVLKQDIEDAFVRYGRILNVWVARGSIDVGVKYPPVPDEAILHASV